MNHIILVALFFFYHCVLTNVFSVLPIDLWKSEKSHYSKDRSNSHSHSLLGFFPFFFLLRFVQTALQLTKYCLNILRWFIANTRHSVFSLFLFLSLCFKGRVLQLSPSLSKILKWAVILQLIQTIHSCIYCFSLCILADRLSFYFYWHS